MENQAKNFSTTRLLKTTEVPFVADFKNYGGLRAKGWKKESTDAEPVVSIVTVVRNDVKHIEKTILSVLNQTYSNVEYIVIDGNSTDGTLDIIKKYENYIDVWVSESDKGLYYAWNKGVDLATGKWVEILNCDDWFYTNTVLADIFAGKKIDADGIYGSMIGDLDGKKVLNEAREDVVKMAWQGTQLVFETLFIKAEIIKKLKFDTRYRVSADGDFVVKCLTSGYKFSNSKMVVFEAGPQGYSANHWLRARYENFLISWTYFPGLKTFFFHFQGLVYFVVFRFFKQLLSKLGIYNWLRTYYRRWFGDKIRREKYGYKTVDDKKY